MKNINRLIASFLIYLLIGACGKEDRLMYKEAPSISFRRDVVMPDSINYTFVVKPDSLLTDTIYLNIRISGVASDKDRKFNLMTGENSTAIKGKHFDIGETVIKAGVYAIKFPVYLHRTPDMKDKIFSIYFRMGSSDDFKAGFDNSLTYQVKVTDKLLKPADWSDFFYGSYSLAKHQFMVSRLGTTAITMGTGAQFSQIMSILQKMRVELIKYENVNGPLIDENGNRVTFPTI
ncbi:DUF4843 domain-containing protein [Chitinophaga arvensicola]|uniref:DUF4843 domain-containing protein n=1 Tax=Chitinophaga arvensicola TaxID=29529 RepID=A0A1I0SBQ0_9BACT|nr:DUF4843 domain-containing protein [Chitinophaga arvensicola]SEW54218.1 protein of unknown function [Chitinophaga arvensicola]